MSTAYVVFIKESTLDESELTQYKSLVGKSFAGREVVVRAAYGRHQVLEGGPIEGMVILEFPNIESASEWYFSPEYQKAFEHRMKGGNWRGIIIEGK